MREDDVIEIRSNIYGAPCTIAHVRAGGWPKPGDKMRFLGRNGDDHERAAALEVMSPGDVFTVASCHVHSWEHSVRFEELGGCWNGVMFERVQDGGKA